MCLNTFIAICFLFIIIAMYIVCYCSCPFNLKSTNKNLATIVDNCYEEYIASFQIPV